MRGNVRGMDAIELNAAGKGTKVLGYSGGPIGLALRKT